MLATGSGRRLEATDMGLAEELARRAALAIDNAMLYEAEEIDAPTYRPEAVSARPPFERRLRGV